VKECSRLAASKCFSDDRTRPFLFFPQTSPRRILTPGSPPAFGVDFPFGFFLYRPFIFHFSTADWIASASYSFLSPPPPPFGDWFPAAFLMMTSSFGRHASSFFYGGAFPPRDRAKAFLLKFLHGLRTRAIQNLFWLPVFGSGLLLHCLRPPDYASLPFQICLCHFFFLTNLPFEP